ncbi:GL13532 [Drosophila persimilis]|uniref:GL13532 n=1 Tax=Drosophila persimilis TaxID=7234 RepID=B4GN85_DROPE|nr:GL13532 [Drosophila persimilis]
MEINMVLSKRLNGYKPFLYNMTFNACKFIANPKSSPVVKFFYESFMSYSSVNHSCPYNHDLVLEKLPVDFINHRFTQILPFPEGQYLLEVRWLRSGSLLAVIKLYGLLS